MKHQLDIETWSRKDHFNFFRQFEEPFFGLVLQLDCAKAQAFCKERGHSFFLFYLHASLVAANATEPFRYRIEGEEVMVHDQIDASPTINRPDGTFGFAYMAYHPDFEQFKIGAKLEIERVQNSTGLELAGSNHNIVHYSSLPWLSFTSLSHARAFKFQDCVPKISFGKMENGKMPVSVHVHHALMDGYHVSQWFERFQVLMNVG